MQEKPEDYLILNRFLEQGREILSEYETSSDEDIIRGRDLDKYDAKLGKKSPKQQREDPLLYRKNLAVTIRNFIKQQKKLDN